LFARAFFPAKLVLAGIQALAELLDLQCSHRKTTDGGPQRNARRFMMQEEMGRGKGHWLSLAELEKLKGLIIDRLDQILEGCVDGKQQKNIKPITEEERDKYLGSLDVRGNRELLIEKILTKDYWYRSLAEIFNADKRTIKKYVLDQKALDKRIAFLKRGGVVLGEEPRQVFVEGVRLLSTTINDLVRFLPLYLPFDLFFVDIPEKTKKGEPPQDGNEAQEENEQKKRIKPRNDNWISPSTFANVAKFCFDTTGTMNIRQLEADKPLLKLIHSSLNKWPVGTVGVHAVDVVWNKIHHMNPSKLWQPGKKGGTIRLLLMAERMLGKDKEMAFSPIPSGADDSLIASEVKTFLASLTIPARRVCLTTELHDGEATPTAMSKGALQAMLGPEIAVTLDAPTRGLGPIEVKGRYESEEDVFRHLLNLLDNPRPAPSWWWDRRGG
jgi:hypothetical protein